MNGVSINLQSCLVVILSQLQQIIEYVHPSFSDSISLISAKIGAYGFLGGSTVGGQGIQNVGLWDQRAAFEWVQQYIPSLGGNINKVTAMGVSAGAGSIMHHITAEGGERNPLFQRAIIQSAGYATVQDTTGAVERKYLRIEEFAGCKDKGLACLRALDEEAMRKVSDYANLGNRKGDSGWDPVVDGIYIVNTPTIEISKGMQPLPPSSR